MVGHVHCSQARHTRVYTQVSPAFPIAWYTCALFIYQSSDLRFVMLVWHYMNMANWSVSSEYCLFTFDLAGVYQTSYVSDLSTRNIMWQIIYWWPLSKVERPNFIRKREREYNIDRQSRRSRAVWRPSRSSEQRGNKHTRCPQKERTSVHISYTTGRSPDHDIFSDQLQNPVCIAGLILKDPGVTLFPDSPVNENGDGVKIHDSV